MASARRPTTLERFRGPLLFVLVLVAALQIGFVGVEVGATLVLFFVVRIIELGEKIPSECTSLFNIPYFYILLLS